MYKKYNGNKYIFIFINVIVCIFFFILNSLTPLDGADDIAHQFIKGTNQRVESVADIIISQKRMYMTWGGRSIVHAIIQFFLMYDKVWFDICNTIVFFVFSFLIYKLVYGKIIDNSFLLFEYMLLWISLPGIGSSVLNLTMSGNYLWGSTFILIFFSLYWHNYFAYTKKNCRYQYIKMLGAFPLGVLCGWSIEAGGAMLLSGITLVMIYQIRKKYKVQLWEISGFAGALIGYAIMILAPGNYVRSAYVKSFAFHSNILVEFGYRIARETYYMLVYMGALLITAAILLVLLKKKKSMKQFLLDNVEAIFLIFLSLLGVYVMTVTVAYAFRALVTPAAFMTAAVGVLYRKYDKRHSQELILCILICGCIFVGMQMAVSIYKMRNHDRLLDIRTEYTREIEEEINEKKIN